MWKRESKEESKGRIARRDACVFAGRQVARARPAVSDFTDNRDLICTTHREREPGEFVRNDGKIHGKIYRLSAFSALPLSTRLASHWYARFGVCRGGGGSRGDLERVDVLVPSLASQRGSWRRVARDSLNLAFTNQRAAASTRKSEGSERRRRRWRWRRARERQTRKLNENEQERDVERDERRAGQFRSLSFRVFALGGSQPDKKKKLTRRQR